MTPPPKPPTKRAVALGAAKSAGYHADVGQLVRLIVETRVVRRGLLEEQYRIGQRLKVAGAPCDCYLCKGSKP